MSKASISSSTNTQGRFLTKNDLQRASSYFQKAAARLEAARLLTERQEVLNQKIAQALSEIFPEIANLLKTKKIALDIEFYIKMVSYCLVSGGTSPVDDYLLANLNEVDQYLSSLGICFDEYINAVKFILSYIKSSHGLSGQVAEETDGYIDYIINTLP